MMGSLLRFPWGPLCSITRLPAAAIERGMAEQSRSCRKHGHVLLCAQQNWLENTLFIGDGLKYTHTRS